MPRFRIRTATVALETIDGGPKTATILPAKSEIEIDYLPDGIRPTTWMIDVRWKGRTITMFLIDIQERGERIDGAAADRATR